VNRWWILVVAAVVGVLGCMVLLGHWREAAAGAAGLGAALGVRPVRWRVSRVIVEAEVRRERREELIHRVASAQVSQAEIAANHRRAADKTKRRRLEAQARLEEIEAQIGGRP
jgi:hypothetical protein